MKIRESGERVEIRTGLVSIPLERVTLSRLLEEGRGYEIWQALDDDGRPVRVRVSTEQVNESLTPMMD